MTDTVTPQREIHSKGGMRFMGYVIALPIAFLLLPVVPILVLIKLLDMLTGSSEPR